jgi:hypothetical protein
MEDTMDPIINFFVDIVARIHKKINCFVITNKKINCFVITNNKFVVIKNK